MAGRILAIGNPFEHYRDELRAALLETPEHNPAVLAAPECTEPKTVAADFLIDAIATVLHSWITDARSVAASALSQDETPA